MDNPAVSSAKMGHCKSTPVNRWRNKGVFKYFVLCTVEKKHSCKIFLAFRVPAKTLHVDYTISDVGDLRQHGVIIADRVIRSRVKNTELNGFTHLDLEPSQILDHYCDRRILCILKRYHCPTDYSPTVIKRRSDNEIGALLKLDRAKHVVTLIDAFEHEGAVYYSMEYLWRGTLRKMIERNRGLDLKTTKTYALQLGDAIAAIHRSGVTHRDMTSANILVTSNGNLKVIDFNLCRLLQDPSEQMNAFLGTYSVMPPEVLSCNLGHKVMKKNYTYTKEIDWWYLGTLIYEMLAWALPFPGADRTDPIAFYNRVSKSPDGIDFTRIEDEDARDIIKQLMQSSPSDRLGAQGGWSHIVKHKFFAGAQDELKYIPTAIDYIDTRIFESIKTIIMGVDRSSGSSTTESIQA